MVLINTATYLNLNAFDYNKRLLLRYRFFVHKNRHNINTVNFIIH